MDEGTVRMVAGVAAEIASLRAVNMRALGMAAENERAKLDGTYPSYNESAFVMLQSEAETIAARLREC